MTTITFGSRGAANQVRDLPAVSAHLAPADDRRSKSVKLKSSVPQHVVSRLQGEAADSRRHEATKTGQVGLTRTERQRIDFTQTSVPAARSIKAVAQAEGVEDWLSFADLTLTVDENRQVLAESSREERGRAGFGRSEEDLVTQRAARGRAAEQQGVRRAVEPALLEQDPDAQDFLKEEIGFGADPFDISLSGGQPTGEDYRTLEERHGRRTRRSRSIDEARAAPVTHDPIEWTNQPDRFDFPGIDTVDVSVEAAMSEPLDVPGADLSGLSGDLDDVDL